MNIHSQHRRASRAVHILLKYNAATLCMPCILGTVNVLVSSAYVFSATIGPATEAYSARAPQGPNIRCHGIIHSIMKKTVGTTGRYLHGA